MIEFLCIGAQKAATSWLYHNLKSHPKIWMPPFIKEVHYYDLRFLNRPMHKKRTNFFIRRAEQFARSGQDASVSPDYIHRISDKRRMYSDEWYEDIFSIAPKSVLRGEITPDYCAIGEDGVKHLKDSYPNVKLIYIIREPYTRMLSSLTMSIYRQGRRHDRTFRDEKELTTACREVINDQMFMMLGDYRSNVPRWDKHFSEADLLYLPFGRVRSAPDMLLKEVEGFIGVAPRQSFGRAEEMIHKGADISIPVEISETLAAAAEPQRSFLRERFGAHFVDCTK